MNEIMWPFKRAWEWVDRTGGYPGQLMVAGLLIMLVVGGITWYSNRR